ncbi:unnamed protein product [Victoria cruziana]
MAISPSVVFQSINYPHSRSSFSVFRRRRVPSRKTIGNNPSWFRFRAMASGDEDYLIDAPVSIGDGFYFSGGKYSDEPSRSDEWFKKGKIVKAYSVKGSGKKAKDPIFGLTMGAASQASTDVFRWFCIENGKDINPAVLLLHGFPSQAILVPGFGFSDKPQPGYGFDYTLDEYITALDSLLTELALENYSLVVQGYFAPVVVKYANANQEKLKKLVLLNPPLMDNHIVLPSTLSAFSNFLFGEIFAQDPLRASDKVLTSCGPYMMKEEDAMVYRRPYLTSGSSGFALTAISRAMKKKLKAYVEDMKKNLRSQTWGVDTTICWGLRDRWLNYEGIQDFCRDSNHKLVELPSAGHHVQEDSGEELGKILRDILRK